MEREGWKSLVVNKLTYGAGALTWYEKECDKLEIMQREMGRWLWGCKTNVKNELVRGETGWSSFKEREEELNICEKRQSCVSCQMLFV